MGDLPARKKPRELLSITVERVDAVDRPATGRKFALVKDENAALVETVRRVVAEHLERESLLAKLRREVAALTLSVQDIRRASDQQRRRPAADDERHGTTPDDERPSRKPPVSPADPKYHVYDGAGNVMRCDRPGECHDIDPQTGRLVTRRREDWRP